MYDNREMCENHFLNFINSFAFDWKLFGQMCLWTLEKALA